MPSRDSLEKQVALFSLNDKNTFVKFLKFLEPEDLQNATFARVFDLQKKHYIGEGVLHDKSFLIDLIQDDYVKRGVDLEELAILREKDPAIESKNFILESGPTDSHQTVTLDFG